MTLPPGPVVAGARRPLAGALLAVLLLLCARAPAQTQPPSPASGKASIAVLAFTNMSGDAEQEYFSDGISEDIITDLSKLPALHVIARNSSFTYKGKAVDVKQVSRE